MVGSISSEHVGGALKDLMAKVSLALQHWEDVIGDLLWLLGEEAMEVAATPPAASRGAVAPRAC